MTSKLILLLVPAFAAIDGVFVGRIGPHPPPFFSMDSLPTTGSILSRLENSNNLQTRFPFRSLGEKKSPLPSLSTHTHTSYKNPEENEIFKMIGLDSGEHTHNHGHDEASNSKLSQKSSFTPPDYLDWVPKKAESRNRFDSIPPSPFGLARYANLFPDTKMGKDSPFSSLMLEESKPEAAEPESQKLDQAHMDFSKGIQSFLDAFLAPPSFRAFGKGNAEPEIHSRHEKTDESATSKCDAVTCDAPAFDDDCKVEEIRVSAPDTDSSFKDLSGCCPFHFCTRPDGSVQAHFGLARSAPQVEEKPVGKGDEDNAIREMSFSSEIETEDGSANEMHNNNGASDDKTPAPKVERLQATEVKNHSPSAGSGPSPFDILSLLGLPMPAQLKSMLKSGNAKIQGPVIITATFSSSDNSKMSPQKILEHSMNPSMFSS